VHASWQPFDRLRALSRQQTVDREQVLLGTKHYALGTN
jgi:hypothetical protein